MERLTSEVILSWGVRLAWVTLPFSTGPALADALDPRSWGVRSTASVGLWATWAVVLVGVLVPRPLGLFALRAGASGAVLTVLAAVLDQRSAGVLLAGAAAAALIVLALAFLPETAFRFVNGAAYGSERRHPLRSPGPLLLGPILIAWVFLVAALACGPLLLAARQWIVGAAAVAVGVPVTFLLGRALYSLSLRWVVYVPAGVVLKDHFVLLDPVLFRRGVVESLGPAQADTDALDLTARSPGLALELVLSEPVPLTFVKPGRRNATTGATTHLIFTPTRPGAVLADATVGRAGRPPGRG